MAIKKCEVTSVVHTIFLLERAALKHYDVVFKNLTEIYHFTVLERILVIFQKNLKKKTHHTLNCGNHVNVMF